MAFMTDNIPAYSAAAGIQHPTLADIVNSLCETLSAALAHTPRPGRLASRRQIEHVLGRKLDPLFALELFALVLAHGREGRELRAAFIRLMSMTESTQWLESLAPGASALASASDEAEFLASEEAAGAKEFARCGVCLAAFALEREVEARNREAAASSQWAHCARCRCATDA